MISFSFWSYLLVMGGCGYCIVVIVVLLLFCCYFITYDKTFMFYQGYITFQTLSGSVQNFFFESKSDNNLRSLLWKSVLNMSLCTLFISIDIVLKWVTLIVTTMLMLEKISWLIFIGQKLWKLGFFSSFFDFFFLVAP